MWKLKRYATTIITTILKTVFSLIGFVFVDDTNLMTAANNAHTSGETMIEQMQTLMTNWCGWIRATGGLIALTKTRWFAITFEFNGLGWQYHTKASLPSNITLPDKDGNIYTVSRKDPLEAYTSLGLQIDFCGTLTAALDDVTHFCQEFSTQKNSAKCNQTSCLDTFATSFMPTLSYRIIATQFTE